MERQCYNIRFYADDIQLFVSVSCSQSGQSNTPVNLSPVISQSHELFFQAFRPHPCTQFLPDCFELQPLLPAVCFGLVSLSQPCLWPARLISTLVKKKKKTVLSVWFWLWRLGLDYYVVWLLSCGIYSVEFFLFLPVVITFCCLGVSWSLWRLIPGQ